jgi:hypothetical protein
LRGSQWSALGEPFDVAFDGGTRDEHAMGAGRTPKTDVSAKPHDPPRIAAARMWLPQDDDVVEKERDRTFYAGRARVAHDAKFSRAVGSKGSADRVSIRA